MELQVKILKLIQSFNTPLLDLFFITITNLGSSVFYYLMVPVFYWGINKRIGIILTSSLMFSMYTNVAIKEIVALSRPIGHPGIRSLFIISAKGFSFPSGHAQGTSTFWGIVMNQAKARWTYVLGIAVIFLVSISRLYLGVHWPIDVLAGILFGLFISFAFMFGARMFNPLPGIYNVLASIIVPVVLTFLFPHPDIFKYMGMLSGIWLGYIVEDKFIGFEPRNKGIIKNVTKYFIGAVGFLVIYTGLKSILPPYNIYQMLKYFIIGIWLTLGAPFLFQGLDL